MTLHVGTAMGLTPGARLAPLEIVSSIGAGGMGEGSGDVGGLAWR
jgi:hypothetical protein